MNVLRRVIGSFSRVQIRLHARWTALRSCARGTSMDEIEADARVILDALETPSAENLP